jgi:hypothetical protein
MRITVDQALPGEEIRLAEGVYSGVQNIFSRNTGTFTATQVVYINKSMTIRGGYTTGRLGDARPGGQPHDAGRPGTGARGGRHRHHRRHPGGAEDHRQRLDIFQKCGIIFLSKTK